MQFVGRWEGWVICQVREPWWTMLSIDLAVFLRVEPESHGGRQSAVEGIPRVTVLSVPCCIAPEGLNF